MNNDFLIVVDPQVDFITGSLKNENAQKAVSRIVQKVFSHFGPIIATMDSHDRDTYPISLEGKLLPIYHCVEDQPGWEIHPDIAKAIVAHGNYVGYVKKSTFGSLDLPEAIKNYIKSNVCIESTNLVTPKDTEPTFTIVGFDTDICVISNALILRAAFPNSKITIDSKCCAGSTPHNHRAALDVAKSCQITII